MAFHSWVANPLSNEPLRRTGSYAVATITAALAIWATTSSSALQSLFLSLSYAVYRALRGHRWLTVHRKQLYQRLPLPPVVQQSPVATSYRPRHLPRLSAPPASPERFTGPCRTRPSSSPSSSTETIAVPECNNSRLHQRPGTSWPLEERRRRRRRLNALHPRRRRRRRRRPRLRLSTKPSLKRYPVVSAPNPRAASRIIETTRLLPRPRRPRLHSSCWYPLGLIWTRKTTVQPAARPATLSWPTGTVNPRPAVIAGAIIPSLWREIAPLEPGGPAGS